jgi:hypothetical protein
MLDAYTQAEAKTPELEDKYLKLVESYEQQVAA